VERTQIFDLMSELKLFGMKAAYDEIMTGAIKRQHEPPRIVGDLLTAEISEKHARSIKYQLTVAKLPLAKDLDDFAFEGTPINERLVRDLATGRFIDLQRNAVLIGGTGAGKTHLAIAIPRACVRAGKRGRFCNTVDLVNKLEAETRAGRRGRLAGGGQLLFHLISRLYERTSVVITTNLSFSEWAGVFGEPRIAHCPYCRRGYISRYDHKPAARPCGPAS
jgi:DNA replication protein DnaC